MSGALAISNGSSSEWSTPRWLFDACALRWGPFDLDVAATAANAKCERFYTRADDGLVQPWDGRVWCNPPYGRGEIELWLRRAASLAHLAAPLTMLLPANTDTAWWHDYVMEWASEIALLRGRVRFETPEGGAAGAPKFGSAVVVFGGPVRPVRIYSWDVTRACGRNRRIT